jgi:Septum formation
MSSPTWQGAQAPMEHGMGTADGAPGPPAPAGQDTRQGPAAPDGPATQEGPPPGGGTQEGPPPGGGTQEGPPPGGGTQEGPPPGGGTQTARPAAGRRPMAAVGLILLLACVVAGTAVGITALITHGFRRPVIVEYRQAAVFSVRAGNCINLTPNGDVVHEVSCAQPHDAEIFGTFRLTGAAWPGKAAVQKDAASGCVSKLGGYLNPQLAATNLTQSYVYPDQTAWVAGERTVVCEIRATSGTLTGSVRGHL